MAREENDYRGHILRIPLSISTTGQKVDPTSLATLFYFNFACKMHDTSAMSFEKVNACRMNKSFTLLAGITELDIENSNSTSERNFQFYQFIRQSFHQILSIRDSFEPIYISKLPWPIIVADLHMIET